MSVAAGTTALAVFVLLLAACGPEDRGPDLRRRLAARLETPGTLGENASLTYDGAGNVVEVSSGVVIPLAIEGFSPKIGCPGQIVTVFGAGFSPNPAGNLVALGGVAAPVVSATGTQLTFAVPKSAMTGTISVTVAGVTRLSAEDFAVVSAVSVIDFTPKLGPVGTLLTVSGYNFDPAPTNDLVSVGEAQMTATSAGLTWAVATIVSTASSGKVRVTTGAGTGTSIADFFLLPPEISDGDVDEMARADPGSAASIGVSGAARSTLLLFDGSVGQRLTLYGSEITFDGWVEFTVYSPDRTPIFVRSVRGVDEVKLVLPALPASGTYLVQIRPEFTSGTMRLGVIVELNGAVQRGIVASITLSRGQDGRFTFTASAGEIVSIAVPSLTTDPVGQPIQLTVLKPDGSTLWTNNVTRPTNWLLPRFPTSGTYSIVVQPGGHDGTPGASIALLIPQPSEGTMVIDGDPVSFEAASAGQLGKYAFAGNAGDTVGLGVSALVTTPGGGNVQFMLNKPDGSLLWAGAASGPTSWQLPVLPTTGTYTLILQPPGTARASATLSLSRPVTGTLDPDGAATVFQATRPGQTGRFTFAATAGQRLTMPAAAGSGLASNIYLTVYRPNGALLSSAQLNNGSDVTLDLGAMPASGTYTVTVVPTGATIGTVTLRLVSYATGALAADEPMSRIELGVGQFGWFSFNGTAGDLLGLGLPTVATAPAGTAVYLTLYRPDGPVLWSTTASFPTSWQLPRLPVSGTYALRIAPSAASRSVSASLVLSRSISGTLATDGTPTVYQTQRVGQAGRYSFSGVAGQRLTLRLTTGAGFANSLAVTVYHPSGAVVTAATVNGNMDRTVDLGVLPATGTYTVTAIPSGLGVGSATLSLVPCATGLLAVGDPPATWSLAVAQYGRFTFTGTAGDRLGVGLASVATSPSGKAVTVTVLKPDGTTLWTGGASGATSWQLPPLPSSGTYILQIVPGSSTSPASASITVLLSRALAGTLGVDGTPTVFQTTRLGQAARYEFSAAAGERFTLRETAGAGLASYFAVAAYQPSGASLSQAQLASGSDMKIDLGALPATGTYVITVVPSGVTTGEVTLRVVPYLTGSISTDGAPLTLSLGAAQNAWLTFAGTSGALLSLSITAASASASFTIHRPDGATLWSGSAGSAVTWALPQLPSAGTYAIGVRPWATASASVALKVIPR